MKMDTPKKQKKRWMTFNESYKVRFPCISESRKGSNFAFCKVCRSDIKIAAGGGNDITNHIKTAKHEANLRAESAVQKSGTLTTFFRRENYAAINAEVSFTDFLVEHSVPLAVSDHAGPLFRKMFPDSDIAKQYACGRTKTWHVVQSLAENDAKDLATRMKHHPYSLATDGSTDMESIKLYPVLVKSYDPAVGQVVCELLSMKQSTERSTGENIFNLLDKELTSWSIPWSNCVSFGTDNAAVMLGKHKGVATLIKQKNPNTYIVGCPCHLMHLAAQKGGKCLQYQIDELLVDIWYYIDKSQLRHQAIISIQQEQGTEVRKILKRVHTLALFREGN